MEPLSTPPPVDPPKTPFGWHSPFTPMLMLGLVGLFLGAALLLDNFNVPGSEIIWNVWPLTIVALGIIKVRNGQATAATGYLLLALGVVLLVCHFLGIGFSLLIGPLWLVGSGTLIILHAVRRRRPVPTSPDRILRALALFTSYRCQFPVAPFPGGELTGLFGGVEVDLRQAVLVEPIVRVDCFILFGGCEITVPEGWEIRVPLTTVFSGVHNRSTPLPTRTGVRPTLYIAGMALFSGIHIRRG